MIRPAIVDDAAGVARCHVLGWQVGCAGVLPGEHLDSLSIEDATARWSSALARPDHRVLVGIAEDGTVGGFARTGATPDPRPGDDPVPGELRELYLAPDHWGTGMAGALHRAALEALVAAGHRSAVLWVVAGNERAIRFYRRYGWRRDGWERTQTAGEATWTELRLRGTLAG